MSFGFQIFDQTGTLRFDSTDTTWNQIAFYYVERQATDVRNFPEAIGKTLAVGQIMVDPPIYDRECYAHAVNVDTYGNVAVFNGSENVYIIVLAKG